MPLVHLVGDPDTDGDRMVRGPVNKTVFVGGAGGNGVSGSTLAAVLGVPQIDDITADEERAILEVLATAESLGIDPNEIELFDDVYQSGIDPITGDSYVEPGSPAASGGLGNALGVTPPVTSRNENDPDVSNTTRATHSPRDRSRADSDWLVPAGGHIDMNVLPQLTEKAIDLAKNYWGQPLTITSAYRSPARNASIEGAARNSLHMQGKAFDVSMNGYSNSDMIRFIDLAAQVGFNGIGMYNPSSRGGRFIHIDIRTNKYYWGPNNSHTTAYPQQIATLINRGFPSFG